MVRLPVALSILASIALWSCSTTTGRANALPGIQVQPRQGECRLQMFDAQPPARPFTRLGSVGARERAGYFTLASKESVYKEIQAQACRLGADGIIEIVEREDRRFEWSELDVSGNAIRFDR